MGFVKEFKEFAVKGNVIDLAVGVIIGGAFGKIIDSVINDLIMPLVAKIIGSPDFSNAYIPLVDGIPPGTSLADAKKIGPVFAYGNFLTVAINFFLLALAVFLMVKAINRLKRKQEVAAPAAPPEPSSTDKLLMEIRDSLKK
ncbi:large conductance mechanosensitive channel protein MscL [Panacibacter ginsenosidivorans]|uniref:Large-conductance mechanosensitive channel n=1 Tax=Panacibacter ginsenosidivorans TaxID=1813871 RepID=A0A5B8VA44_9BACT|nr:large conductance mechanosensitive channel protein MscL [Panacibacter ginsenosidivorans]QEC67813.1 large conductance mechanosensitive channel protein MscL [Panacibacter ginsenosidivorans]